ncbi:CidA/LrgA family protein [Pseudomonas sp. S31]|nr:CidA/LrgA family protein [Pseudomonas sp. S31]
MLDLPVSGGILGLAMLVVLLLTGLVKPRWIEGGAELILANMLLYFIPLVVSVVQYKDLFETVGIKLFVAIGTGFLAVMLVTALVVEGVCQLIRKQHFRKVLQVRKERALLGGDR